MWKSEGFRALRAGNLSRAAPCLSPLRGRPTPRAEGSHRENPFSIDLLPALVIPVKRPVNEMSGTLCVGVLPSVLGTFSLGFQRFPSGRDQVDLGEGVTALTNRVGRVSRKV